MNAPLNLAVVDWSRTRRADLTEVPRDMRVGEVISDLREPLQLGRETPYHLIHGGTKLNRGITLDEAGIEDGEELVIAPEVSAG